MGADQDRSPRRGRFDPSTSQRPITLSAASMSALSPSSRSCSTSQRQARSSSGAQANRVTALPLPPMRPSSSIQPSRAPMRPSGCRVVPIDRSVLDHHHHTAHCLDIDAGVPIHQQQISEFADFDCSDRVQKVQVLDGVACGSRCRPLTPSCHHPTPRPTRPRGRYSLPPWQTHLYIRPAGSLARSHCGERVEPLTTPVPRRATMTTTEPNIPGYVSGTWSLDPAHT